jgi:hypothetical protein
MRGKVRSAILLAGGLGVAGVLVTVFGPRLLPRPVPGQARAHPLPTSAERAAGARAAAIRTSGDEIRALCQRAAGGDWQRWEEQTRTYRTDLQHRIDAASPFNPTAGGGFEARSPVLAAKDDFPLFESAPEHYLAYLTDPDCLGPFRKDRPVAVAAQWLKQKGIDVLFVAIPKMTEVYPEHFAEPCPADRIVAPHVRRMLLELLEADVEVIDALPLLLAEREGDPEPLYQPADPHWGPRGQAIVARAVASRLKRYPFVTAAQPRPPVWKESRAPYQPASAGACFLALTPQQRQRAENAQPRIAGHITNQAGEALNDPSSPVVLIGDSSNDGLSDFLGKELNLPLHWQFAGGQTTQAFTAFLRDPELLKDCKVVVWLVSIHAVVNPWPLPGPIRAAVQ